MVSFIRNKVTHSSLVLYPRLPTSACMAFPLTTNGIHAATELTKYITSQIACLIFFLGGGGEGNPVQAFPFPPLPL